MQPADKRIALVSDVNAVNARVDDIDAAGVGDIGEAINTAVSPGGAASDSIKGTIADYTGSLARKSDIPSPITKNTVIVAGDSIAAQCPTIDVAIAKGRFDQVSWLDWANTELDQRLTVIRNAGVGGDTTTQFLARLENDVINQPGEIVALCAGVNDLFNGQGTTLATMKANLTEIVDRILAAGKRIAWNTTTASGFATSVTKPVQQELNAWIKEHGAKFPGAVTVIDMFAVNDDGNGNPWEGYARTEDNPTPSNRGVHPGLFGAAMMGSAWAKAMRGQILGYGATPNTLSDGYNLIGKLGSFVGDTDGVSDGWALQSTNGQAKPASVIGKKVDRVSRGEQREMQMVDRTNPTEGARLFFQNTDVGGDWNPGDTAVFSITMEHGNYTSTEKIAGIIRVDFWNGKGILLDIGIASSPFTGPTPTGKPWLAGRRTHQTPPAVIPPGTERIQLSIQLPVGKSFIESAVMLSTPA